MCIRDSSATQRADQGVSPPSGTHSAGGCGSSSGLCALPGASNCEGELRGSPALPARGANPG
eukprot:9002884-Alexandrium_andersonii.AAC.1